MHVICNDGTTIQCQDFKATDSGVLFFQETPGRRESEDEEDEEEMESASGFVPVTQLRFVLPDEMVQQATAQPAGTPQSGGVPPGAGAQQGGMAQQQTQHHSGAPGSPPRRPPESGGR